MLQVGWVKLSSFTSYLQVNSSRVYSSSKSYRLRDLLEIFSNLELKIYLCKSLTDCQKKNENQRRFCLRILLQLSENRRAAKMRPLAGLTELSQFSSCPSFSGKPERKGKRIATLYFGRRVWFWCGYIIRASVLQLGAPGRRFGGERRWSVSKNYQLQLGRVSASLRQLGCVLIYNITL